jgi:hypothetical protein
MMVGVAVIKKLIILCILLSPLKAFALMEINGEFGYRKQVFGLDRESSQRSRTYSGSYALYLFNSTAVELNYYSNKDVITVGTARPFTAPDGDALTVLTDQRTIETRSYGVGLRQALAGRNARWRPMFSFGYARQFVQDSSNFTIQQDSSGVSVNVENAKTKRREDSVFASFILQFKLSKHMSVNASVKSVFPAFEFTKAKDDLKYLVGLAWLL